LFRLGIDCSQTTQLPSIRRLGTNTLFLFAAQDRVQKRGLLVFFPQTGHAVMAILSKA